MKNHILSKGIIILALPMAFLLSGCNNTSTVQTPVDTYQGVKEKIGEIEQQQHQQQEDMDELLGK